MLSPGLLLLLCLLPRRIGRRLLLAATSTSCPYFIADPALLPVRGRVVVHATLELGGKVLLIDPAGRIVVRILVPPAVAELRGATVVGVPQMEGNLAAAGRADVLAGLPDPERHPVRLGCCLLYTSPSPRD